MGLFDRKPPGPAWHQHGNATLHTWIKPGPDDVPLSKAIYDAGTTAILLGNNPASVPGTKEKPDPDHGFYWSLTNQRGHGLCFSTTGGGKNTNIITPALLSYGGSAFVLDPKGENAWITAPRRRQLGQRTVIIDPWNKVNETYGALVGEREQTSRFNPLSTLDPRAPDFADDVTLIADGIIIAPQGADPHWPESARELVAGLIAASVEKAPGIASFRDVRALLTAPEDVLARRVKAIVASNPDSLAGRKLQRFTKDTKEISSIRSTALTQTAIFDAAALLDSMDTEPGAFDMADLVRQQVTVYVVLPANKLLTHGRWMRLIIQLALRAIARQPQPPRFPILFLLDELGTINPGGGLKMIEQAYGLLGGMGVRIFGFFQNLSQLQHDYPHTWQTFIANCEIIQLLRLNDNETSEYFSRLIGNFTINTGTTERANYEARPVLLPQELRQLQPNEAVILRSGRNGFRLPTVPYFREPRWAGKYRPNPLFAPEPPAPPPPPHAAKPSLFDSILTPDRVAWLKADAAVSAERAREAANKAAEWARTDGAEHARAAADLAAVAAAKASKWLGSKLRHAQDKPEAPPAPPDVPER